MATLRARVSSWLGPNAPDEPSTRVKTLGALLLAAGVAVVAFPAGVWAADAFTDVPESNVHHGAVSAITAADVTEGCAPEEYCPERPVRRDQMASFMDRLGGLSGQEPVVNAATAQTAETAETAENVEGFDAVLARLDELEDDNAALNQRVAELEAAEGNGGGELATRVDALEAQVADLEAENAGLEQRVGALEETLEGVTREERQVGDGEDDVRDTLVFEGMNLQLLNGEDTTAAANGLGNLVVGYNAGSGQRSGSHNVVVGDEHEWTSWGGIVAGTHNAITNTWASVLGGRDNIASGEDATVTGGFTNVASGRQASVTGGHLNVADDFQASVTGGVSNTASGIRATVSGGEGNVANGARSSVSGGENNTASGSGASILGGASQTVSGTNDHYPN